MTFIFDRCLSKQLVEGLRAFGETDIHYLDELGFSQDAADTTWLKHAGENGITVITKDKDVQRHRAEREALKEHRVGAFVLVGKNQKKWDLIVQVIRNWTAIKDLAEKTPPPFIFKVRPRGERIEPSRL